MFGKKRLKKELATALANNYYWKKELDTKNQVIFWLELKVRQLKKELERKNERQR